MTDVPLSLYFQLKQGEYAEADVASRATIEFVSLVKQVAYFLDPDSVVDVQLISGTEGSLGQNTISRIRDAVLKAGEAAELVTLGLKRKRIHWLALFVAFRIANNAVDWTQSKVMDWLTGDSAPKVAATLTDDERREIAADIVAMMRQEIAKEPVRRVYRECERDDKIEGLGVAEAPKQRPRTIIPKERFYEFSEADIREGVDERTVTERIGVTLISPVLLPGERRWRFRGASGEFGAPVRDTEFTRSVLSGSLGIPMQAGVALDIDLETKEARSEGVWQIEGRAVTRVHGWKAAPSQPDLLDGPTGDVADN